MSSIGEYDKCVLLLPMFGSDSGTVFSDYSPQNLIITPSGGAATKTAQYKYYDSSAYFDGTGDYLTASSVVLNFGTAPWYADVWIRYSGTTNAYPLIFANGAASWTAGAVAIAVDHAWNTNKVIVTANSHSTTTAIVATTTSVVVNEWHHIRVERNGTSLKIYYDGVNEATATISSGLIFDFTGLKLFGGGWDGAASAYAGYIQDLCLYKATPPGANFTPPTKLIGTISNSGTTAIKDDTNANAERRIKAIQRGVDGGRIFATTSNSSGVYSVLVPDIQHNVVFEDDSAGTQYSDILVSHVTPT